MGKTKKGKGTKIMGIIDAQGVPLALHTCSASPHEATLVAATLDDRALQELPDKLIGDKAYDSDPLDQKIMNDYGVEMISPHKINRKKKATQDGRKLRRYRKRWKVERFFAWLQNFRKVVVRYEYHLVNFTAFVKLAAIIILMRFLG